MKNAIWAVIAVIAALWYFGGREPSGPRDPTSDEIETAARAVVRAHLPAPNAAKFPSKPAVKWEAHDRFATVSGLVDAQNAFGAMRRADFYVVLHTPCREKFSAEGCWIVHQLTIGDTEPVTESEMHRLRDKAPTASK